MLKARTLLGVLMATLAVVGTAAVAGPLEDAVVAHEGGDYATVMRLSRPLAEQGDPRAQLMLGIMLDDGAGVPHDFAEALRWFRWAADQGNAKAQSRVGRMYQLGRGVPQGGRAGRRYGAE